MGWLFSSNLHTKADLIRHITEEAIKPKMRTIAKAVRGNVLWAVHEYIEAGGPNDRYKVGDRWIGCYLMGSDHGWWGSKDMDEGCGPCEVSCPVKFFDMVPDPGGYATEWRARVRLAATKKATQNAKLSGITVGCKVRLVPGCKAGGVELTELRVVSVKPLLAEMGFMKLRIPRRMIAEVLPSEVPPAGAFD